MEQRTRTGINEVHPKKSISISLGNYCTVFQIKVRAIAVGIQESIEMECTNKSIFIFTGS